MKPYKGHTINNGNVVAVGVVFWQSKPRRSFIRFQSKHVYRGVFNPLRFVIEFLEATGPTALESWFCGVHGDRRSGGRCRVIRPINGKRERPQLRSFSGFESRAWAT